MMSNLKDNIAEQLKTAMKARESETVKVLRGLQAAIKQIEIDEQVELDDKGVLNIIQKQIKQRQESLNIYQSNGRDDLAQKEQFELDVISSFLPAQLSEAQLTTIINETIQALGAADMKDMGRVMNAVKEKTTGQADPAIISALVKKALSA